MALVSDPVFVINAYGANATRTAGIVTWVSGDGTTVNVFVIPDAETPYHLTGLTTTVSSLPYYIIARTS